MEAPINTDRKVVVGNKPMMVYVNTITMQLVRSNDPFTICARGQNIMTAIYALTFLKEKQGMPISIMDIKLSYEKFDKEGNKLDTPSITFTVRNSNGRVTN